MGIRFIKEPELINPVMIACWPGIGNIGLIAVDNMRRVLQAEEMAYIEPWDFFYPSRVIIHSGEIREMQFPASMFYFKKTGERDLIFFIGEEQPAEGGRVYAEGSKAYAMANLVLDIAERFGCKRIYTSGAAVAPIHHTARSRVWVVPNSKALLPEVKKYDNCLLMSDIEGRGGQGNITGLNGLLLGVAGRRGLEAVCMMGEIPVYLQGFPFPYPKASKSVLEVLTSALGVPMEMESINGLAEQSEFELSSLYEKLPPEIKEQLDRLKQVLIATENNAGIITEEDKKKILEDIDKFFKKEGREEQH
ncbi:MAG: PAC2 family protein [Dehalococcoidia bacterium]|nr:PAC2 family protein [Dehalococcoidia bacterium]MDD5495046.1 PAC2 family protein [Dehalococcoidia bacterium]